METLSNYSPSALATLYSTKNKLTKHDLAYAKSCWEVLARSNEEEIRQFDFGKSKKFSYLKSAINQHFERFPDANGLNKIDYKILEIVHAKPRTFKEIVRELLLWQDAHTCFGFGDVQYFAYIKKLQKYFYLKENQYFLNHIGKKTYTKNGCK